MTLPGLSFEEKAFLAAGEADRSAVGALAERVRCKLTAALRQPVSIREAEPLSMADRATGGMPNVEPGAELVACWVDWRFGGVGKASQHQGARHFSRSLICLLEQAWAETVVNLGGGASWPAAIGLELAIGEQRCRLDFHASPEGLMAWAELELGRTR